MLGLHASFLRLRVAGDVSACGPPMREVIKMLEIKGKVNTAIAYAKGY